MTDQNKPDFVAFANEVLLDGMEHGGLDCFDIEALATRHGLLKEIEMKGPCGEHCNCEGNGTEFPTKCLQKTYSVFTQPQHSEVKK